MHGNEWRGMYEPLHAGDLSAGIAHMLATAPQGLCMMNAKCCMQARYAIHRWRPAAMAIPSGFRRRSRG